MNQKPILYLNQADGRKPHELTSLKVKNTSSLFKKLEKAIRVILSLSNKDFLGFTQNTTTSLIYGIFPIIKRCPNLKILVSTHEIRWYKNLFSTGKLPGKETTYPNYAKQKEVNFTKKKILIFDPYKFIKNPEYFISSRKPSLIILSHVSRLTGELLITPKLYRRIKKINKDNIVVIDGCQAVGAIPVKPNLISDIYLGVTSKFIGAEPHLSFYWISSQVEKQFNIVPQSINSKLFFREIYSAVKALENLKRSGSNLLKINKYFKKRLTEYKIIYLKLPKQQNHIILIPEKESKLPGILKSLRKNGIVVSLNTGFSINEPKCPSLRISIAPRLKFIDIDYVVQTLTKIKGGLRMVRQ